MAVTNSNTGSEALQEKTANKVDLERAVTIANGLTRRSVLLGSSAAALDAVLRPAILRAAVVEKQLVAALGEARLHGPAAPGTTVWCYNGMVPGPELRVRQNDRMRIVVANQLPQDTTIHWHGVRVPNAMDGAPNVTQPAIESGGNFVYDYIVPDAGTYWYHPHAHSSEQVGRGLTGAFIVEEPIPLPVDRDIAWLLGDFRLKPDSSISSGFNNPMETAMSGRVGNTVTINGQVLEDFEVRSGERVRLRLINATPARIFGLEFRGLEPIVIAYDGQPVEPHSPEGGRVVLGPAMRIDLVIDMMGKPGSTTAIVDSFYDDLAYKLVEFKYSDEPPITGRSSTLLVKLPVNPIAEPDVTRATTHSVTLTGGMNMNGMMGGGMTGMMGGMGQMMMGGGPMWAINGVAAQSHRMGSMLTLTRGGSYILAIDNQTAWYHPIHLHGHSFRVLTRNGQATTYREWRDTMLVPPREKAEVAFVADNPGDWMFHCHILDHQEGGMMSVIHVS